MYSIFVPRNKVILTLSSSINTQVPISIVNPVNILDYSLWNYVEYYDKNYFYLQGNNQFRFKKNFQAILSGKVIVSSKTYSNALYITKFNMTNNKFISSSYSVAASPTYSSIDINNLTFGAYNNNYLGFSFITTDDIIIRADSYSNLIIVANNS